MRKIILGLVLLASSFSSFGMCAKGFYSSGQLAYSAVGRYLEDNEISFDRCSNMKAKVSVGQTLELAKRCGQIGKEITISIILSPQDLTHPCSTGEDQYYVVINGEVYSKDADRSQMGVH